MNLELTDEQNLIDTIAKKINYRFQSIKYLKESLTHPSCNNGKSYERLEILGDAVLSLLITDNIFHVSDLPESVISKIRSYLVSGEVLYEIANNIQIGDFLIMSKGEENLGGRKNKNNLENTLEALIAAVYIDGGIESARLVVNFLWKNYKNTLFDKDNLDFIDPKSYIQEWAVLNKYSAPSYVLQDRIGSDHEPIFTVCLKVGPHVEYATGSSIKLAQKQVARQLLLKIKKL